MSENPFFKEFLAAAGLPPTPDLPEPEPEPVLQEGPGDLRQSDPQVKRLCAWLGPDTVLVPLDGTRSAEPLKTDYSITTLEQSLSPAYQSQLPLRNVGVLTGTSGGRLCAIRFDRVEGAEQFLVVNPLLRATLRTKSCGKVELWVRGVGWIPLSQNLDGIFWLGEEGWIEIATARFNFKQFEILHPANPVEVRVLHLAWDEGRRNFLLEQFCAFQHGPPVTLNAQGKQVPNYYFWAAFLAELMSIRYHPRTKKFYWRVQPQAPWRPLEPEPVQVMLTACLRRIAGDHCAHGYLDSYTTPARLKPFLAAMRTIAADSDLPVPDSLDHYLALRVERCAGQSLTSQELFADYRAACGKTSVAPLPERAFKHQIRQAIERGFAIGRSNCIMREGTAHRGFLNLGFKTAAPKTGVDASDATDATDALNPITR